MVLFKKWHKVSINPVPWEFFFLGYSLMFFLSKGSFQLENQPRFVEPGSHVSISVKTEEHQNCKFDSMIDDKSDKVWNLWVPNFEINPNFQHKLR